MDTLSTKKKNTYTFRQLDLKVNLLGTSIDRDIDARAFDLTGNAAFAFLGGIDWENSHVAWSVQHGILSFLFQE